MPQINAAFVTGVNSLAALAYALNIDCPPLRNLAKWTVEQGGATGTATPTPRTAATATRTPTAKPRALDPEHKRATLAAITSSPNGVDLADLVPILKPKGLKATDINRATKVLRNEKLTEQKGGIWYATAAGVEADRAGNGTVDRTMPRRRTTRAAAQQTPAPKRTRTRNRKAKTANGAGTDAQQAAGAAD